MKKTEKDITRDVEGLQKNHLLELKFQERAGDLERFYQQMLAAGIARKEEYNIVATGQAQKLEASCLIRG